MNSHAEVDRVPVCGAKGLTVSRAIWDEAWIAYAKKYGGSANDRQHARLLREGFYEGELDDLRPGWRPIDQRIEQLEHELAEAKGVIARHDLCHNLHGKVDAVAFAEGCAEEQRKLYGCAPHADRITQLETAMREMLASASAHDRAFLHRYTDEHERRAALEPLVARVLAADEAARQLLAPKAERLEL